MLPVALIIAIIGLASTIVSTGPQYINIIENQHSSKTQSFSIVDLHKYKYYAVPNQINPLKK